MRKYLLPVLLFSAIGAVIIAIVRVNDSPDKGTRKQEPSAEGGAAPETTEHGPKPGPRPDVQVSENEALSELQRVLNRKDLKRAYHFRQKVCEQIGDITKDKRLREALLRTIVEQGINSDDPRKRDILLPILRVFPTEEATKVIDAEFYRARNENERMVLLEAMSHSYHDPAKASVWAVDLALNAEVDENRDMAFTYIKEYSGNEEVVSKTAIQIYEASTQERQRLIMLDAIAERGSRSEAAEKWCRQRLAHPRADELRVIAGHMDTWGTMDDAAYLETLALEFPEQRDQLRDKAEEIRHEIKVRLAAEGKLDPKVLEEEERARNEGRTPDEPIPPGEPKEPEKSEE